MATPILRQKEPGPELKPYQIAASGFAEDPAIQSIILHCSDK